MAWTTEITSKIIVDGLLKVEVAFSDGKQIFKDRYETRNLQDDNWLNDNIKRRISDLDGVIALADTIVKGEYIVKEPLPVEPVITPKELYQKSLRKYNVLLRFVNDGIIENTNKDFVEAKDYLIKNFDISYII